MNRKIKILRVFGAVILFTVLIQPVFAATYYVRADGGTATQCNGLSDSAYPGSGTNQSCAFEHPFWAISPAGSPTILAGGDTLIIGPGSYRMGLGAPNTKACAKEYPWDCFMRNVPSGPDTNTPTRILGRGWNTGCSVKPELWGTERAAVVLNLRKSDNVEVQCLDVTDHSSCMEYGPDRATRCNRSTYPYGDWASVGIASSDSENVLIKNVSVHGLLAGVRAGRLQNWALENVDILRNSFVGWDGDIGANNSANSGTLSFKRVRILFSGCGETYPGDQPHHCYSQDQGGYGDGLGTHKTGGHWTFEDSEISHNVSDGLDLLYHTGDGSVTIKRSRFEGNAGNQVKTAGTTFIENSLMIGNCDYFSGKSFTATTDINFNPRGFNHCRAFGNTVAVEFKPNSTLEIYNSTIYGNGDLLVEGGGTNCVGTEWAKSRNNIYYGDLQYGGGSGEKSDLYYNAGATGNGDGTCAYVKLDDTYSIIYNVKRSPCPKDNVTCKNPLFVGPMSGDEYNVYLTDNSPARGAALYMANVSAHDYNRFERGAQWDLGGLEFGSFRTPSSEEFTSTPSPDNGSDSSSPSQTPSDTSSSGSGSSTSTGSSTSSSTSSGSSGSSSGSSGSGSSGSSGSGSSGSSGGGSGSSGSSGSTGSSGSFSSPANSGSGTTAPTQTSPAFEPSAPSPYLPQQPSAPQFVAPKPVTVPAPAVPNIGPSYVGPGVTKSQSTTTSPKPTSGTMQASAAGASAVNNQTIDTSSAKQKILEKPKVSKEKISFWKKIVTWVKGKWSTIFKK